MSSVRNFFLRAKHWQIFLSFVLFSILDMIPAASLANAASQSSNTLNLAGMTWGFVTSACLLWFIAWLWSMASFLDDLIPANLKLGKRFFRFACIYPLIYVPFFAAFFVNKPQLFISIVFPLHLLATFCMFYLLYFVSKNLSLVETRRSVSFYDYAGPFFLLWFFPWVSALSSHG